MTSFAPGRSRREAAELAASSIWFDVRVATNHIVRNSIGGSMLLPRVLRVLYYRLIGFPFETANLAAHLVIMCPPGRLRIGPEVAVSRGCYFEGSGQVDIGARTLVGQEVAFITSAHRVLPDSSIERTPEYRDVSVGTDCWIGARATILGGATLGDNVIVTAGSVVAGRCESGFVYAGVPARKIGRVSALATAEAS